MFPACDLPSLFRFFIWPEYAVALQEFCNFCKIPHQLDPENSCFFNRRVSAGFCKNCKILQKGRGSGYVKYLKSNRFLHMVMRSLPRQKDRFATTLQNCKSYCKKGTVSGPSGSRIPYFREIPCCRDRCCKNCKICKRAAESRRGGHMRPASGCQRKGVAYGVFQKMRLKRRR